MDHDATLAASVYFDRGCWMLALESSDGSVVELLTTGWDGSGSFHQHGLDFVGRLLAARGLRYRHWAELGGRYVAVLHQPPRWGQS